MTVMRNKLFQVQEHDLTQKRKKERILKVFFFSNFSPVESITSRNTQFSKKNKYKKSHFLYSAFLIIYIEQKRCGSNLGVKFRAHFKIPIIIML